MNDKKVIKAPRSFWIVVFQLSGLVCVVVMVASFINTELQHLTVAQFATLMKDRSYLEPRLIMLAIFLLPVFLILLLCPQWYIPRLSVDLRQGKMRFVKKWMVKQEYDIEKIKQLLSKGTRTNLTSEYKLIVENQDGTTVFMLNDPMVISIKFWERFAERVALAIDKPLIEERWREDFNGKITTVPSDRANAESRRGKFGLFVPVAITLIGALCYRLSPSMRSFYIFGIVSILANLAFFIFFFARNRDMQVAAGSKTMLVTMPIITSVIPSSTLYVIFVLMLSGFRLPFFDIK
jgi:hypothetical protein